MSEAADDEVDEPQTTALVAAFAQGVVVDDPSDHAVVARGRTELGQSQLEKSLYGAMKFLGVPQDGYAVTVQRGRFELRVSRAAVEALPATNTQAVDALKLFVGFGLLGVALYVMVVPWAAGIAWGLGLLLGGWQLRRGVASGRAMLAGKLAFSLATIARAEPRVLPPGQDDPS